MFLHILLLTQWCIICLEKFTKVYCYLNFYIFLFFPELHDNTRVKAICCQLLIWGGDHWFSNKGCQLSIRMQKQLLYYHKSDIDLCLAQGEIYLAFIIQRLRSIGLSYCSFLHQKRSQSSERGSRPLLTIHTDTDIVGLFKLELS